MPAVRRQKLPINPAVLRWARDWAGFDINTAATRAGVDPDRLIEWERDATESSPTVRQARILADLYERPFLEFFQARAPQLKRPELIPDFRLYRDAVSPRQRLEFEKLQAWAETQRDNALDLFAEIGEEPPAFPSVLYSTVQSNVEDAAYRARNVLAFPIIEQLAIRSDDRERIPTIIREKIERAGVLTLREAGLKRLRARGFCIAEFPLPVIVFGGESPKAQAYTLMHEFGHLMLQQSAISGAITRMGGSPGVRATEKWCNKFAAAFLMPREQVLQIISVPVRRLP